MNVSSFLSNFNLKLVMVSLIGICISLLRPTAIGEVYSIYICALLGCLILLFLSLFVLTNGEWIIENNLNLNIQIVLLLFVYLYIFCRTVFLVENPSDSIKFISISLLFVSCIFIILTDKESQLYLFDAIAIFVLFSCFSIIVSFVLLAIDISPSSLIVGHIDFTYAERGDIIFPFTFIFNPIDTWAGYIPRLSGLYREPGCFPPFACWAAAYAYWRKWPPIFVVISIVASVLSLSSMGPLSIYTGLIILAHRFGLKPQSAFIILMAIILVFWPLLYSLDFIGLESKVASGSESFDERYKQFFAFFDTENFLFGDGSGWSVFSTENISVISASRTFGVIYLFFITVIFAISSRFNFLFYGGIIPAVVVVYTAQPIVLEPAFIVLAFSWVLLPGKTDARFKS